MFYLLKYQSEYLLIFESKSFEIMIIFQKNLISSLIGQFKLFS
jgi:hypothetical protein